MANLLHRLAGLPMNPMANFGIGMLAESGPSPTPVGWGRPMAAGFRQMQGAQLALKQLAFQQQQLQMQKQRAALQQRAAQMQLQAQQQALQEREKYRELVGGAVPRMLSALTAGGRTLTPQEQLLAQVATANPEAGLGPLLDALAPAQRQILKDAAGRQRYADNGQYVFPDVAIPEEKPAPSDVAGMRKEFTAQSKDFIAIRDAYGKIEAAAAAPSAAGDLALIFGYMKLLDPTSVVREGEQASARNAAGIPEQIRNLYNRVTTGQQLAPAQRADFVGQARRLMGSQLRFQRQTEQEFRALAERQGFDPAQVVVDVIGPYRSLLEQPPGAREPTPGKVEPARPQTAAEFNALPPGTVFIDPGDGKTYTKTE